MHAKSNQDLEEGRVETWASEKSGSWVFSVCLGEERVKEGPWAQGGSRSVGARRGRRGEEPGRFSVQELRPHPVHPQPDRLT